MFSKYLAILVLFSFGQLALAQADLLGELEEISEPEEFNFPAFKAMKIVNLQSTKVAAKGDLYMYVSHRFGTIKDGVTTFFGLDNASTKIQMVYGLSDHLQLGASRESLQKTYAVSAKVKLLEQGGDMPFNIVLFHTTNINTQLSSELYPFLTVTDRMSYVTQLLLSRRVSNKLSLQVAPTVIRHNTVATSDLEHNQYALGLGGRYKLTKRLSFNVDYAHNFNISHDEQAHDPLSIGIDIETGGHVFQLLFTNSQSTNEPIFLSYASGDWSEGDIFFGFNIVRVF